MLGDEALLEQQGGELGARLDDLERGEQLERLAGAVGLTLQEVVARAPAQVLGLADVQGVPALVAHDVHAGRRGQAFGEHDLVIVAPRPGLAEAGHLLQRGHAFLLQASEEDEQQLGGGLSVG
jgi:hypothetical protein